MNKTNLPYSFACGCSDESVAEAEGWLRSIFPGLDEADVAIRTGEIRHYKTTPKVKNPETGEWEDGETIEGSYPEHRKMSLVEDLMLILEEEGNARRMVYSVSVESDQWCAISVVGRPWGTVDEKSIQHFSAQYDYGLLQYALAACILQIRERFPVGKIQNERGDSI